MEWLVSESQGMGVGFDHLNQTVTTYQGPAVQDLFKSKINPTLEDSALLHGLFLLSPVD